MEVVLVDYKDQYLGEKSRIKDKGLQEVVSKGVKVNFHEDIPELLSVLHLRKCELEERNRGLHGSIEKKNLQVDTNG